MSRVKRSPHAGGAVVSRVKRSPQQITDQSDQRNQHERYVRDAIARSLLTLPFASLDRDDPFGPVYVCYKQLLECAETGELPPAHILANLVERIRQDASIHEMAGNFLKADIERRWSEGLLLHFSWGQGLVTP